MAHVKIGTRKSPLALWQAEHVAAELKSRDASLTVELVGISTKGDKILDAPLAKVGGKGLFVKEIEEALLDGRVDLAVHSLKDMPAVLPEGLVLAAFPPRADPRDAFVSTVAKRFSELPPNARVGTSSLRRQCQVLAARADVSVEPIRGSVETRLNKLQTEGLHAVILASAGLERLGLSERIARRLEPQEMLPAVGQGILAIEVRERDAATVARIAALDDENARRMAIAERALLGTMGGSCQVPVAGYAVLDEKGWWLRGLVARPDGKDLIRAEARAPAAASVEDMRALGVHVGTELLERGGRQILDELKV